MGRNSLVTQRVDRIERGWLEIACKADEFRGPDTGDHADAAAEYAQGYRLDQELHFDRRSTRTDRNSNADLASAFGDANQHDVHDADAAHEQ